MKHHKITVMSEDSSVTAALKSHYDTDAVASKSGLLKKLESAQAPLVVIDCDVKGCDALALYREMTAVNPSVKAILLSSSITIPQAVLAARAGILDCIRKPIDTEKLIGSVTANFFKEEHLPLRFRIPWSSCWLLGGGSRMEGLFRSLENAVNDRKNVVFVAEAGIDTGSLAAMIHGYTGKGRALVEIDLLPFSKENMESMFWTVLQEAISDAGTLHLRNFDHADAKQQKSVIDYIKSKTSAANLKIIASTARMEEHDFILDWVKANVPPLRERKEDLPAMLEGYIRLYSRKYAKDISGIDLEALSFVSGYSWPGNYRELACALEDAVMRDEDGMISLKDLPVNCRQLYDVLHGTKEELLAFRSGLEKGLVKAVFRKTGSEGLVAAVLDIPKERVSRDLSD